MRAGFELYRAFPADYEHNRVEVEREGKLKLPILAMAGTHSAFAPFTEAMMREVAKDVIFRTVDRANHWVPEENAEGLAAEILAFLGWAEVRTRSLLVRVVEFGRFGHGRTWTTKGRRVTLGLSAYRCRQFRVGGQDAGPRGDEFGQGAKVVGLTRVARDQLGVTLQTQMTRRRWKAPSRRASVMTGAGRIERVD